MAQRIDWFSRLASAAERIDRAEAAAARAAKQLERVRRPDLVGKYERAGKAAEARRRTAERDFAAAERKLLGTAPTRKKRPASPPSQGASYMVTVDYHGRKGHTRYVEFVLHAPHRVTTEQVRRAVSGFARGKPPQGWTWDALRYGRTEGDATAGRVRELEELQGLLMQERSVTVGEL